MPKAQAQQKQKKKTKMIFQASLAATWMVGVLLLVYLSAFVELRRDQNDTTAQQTFIFHFCCLVVMHVLHRDNICEVM